jgi:hypothetical protein|tara:strand:- start:401 stop:505 length:105 start_codon:yes stop_codon:yes gene_type:complete
MNSRLIVAGVALAIIVIAAFLMGSPMFGGFDLNR